MKGLLRFLGLLVVTAFLTISCAPGLLSIKPDTDPKAVIKVVMKEVDKCTPNGDGWKMLEMKDRHYSENGIKYVAFKHSEGDWGIGLVNDQRYAIMALLYHVATKQWVVISFFQQPITNEEALQLQKEWVILLLKEGDLTTAKTYEHTPWPEELPKTEI